MPQCTTQRLMIAANILTLSKPSFTQVGNTLGEHFELTPDVRRFKREFTGIIG